MINPKQWDHFERPKPPPISGIQDPIGIHIGEVKGWRCWEYDAFDDLLHSVVYPQFKWYPGIAIKSPYPPSIEGDNNTCGIHLYKKYEGTGEWTRLPTMTMRYPLVVGTVAAWGTVIEHEYGYRAEYAIVTSIDIVIFDHNLEHKLREKLQNKYNVSYASAVGM